MHSRHIFIHLLFVSFPGLVRRDNWSSICVKLSPSSAHTDARRCYKIKMIALCWPKYSAVEMQIFNISSISTLTCICSVKRTHQLIWANTWITLMERSFWNLMCLRYSSSSPTWEINSSLWLGWTLLIMVGKFFSFRLPLWCCCNSVMVTGIFLD